MSNYLQKMILSCMIAEVIQELVITMPVRIVQ